MSLSSKIARIAMKRVAASQHSLWALWVCAAAAGAIACSSIHELFRSARRTVDDRRRAGDRHT